MPDTVRITIDQLARLIKQLSETETDPLLKGITPSIPNTNAIGGSTVLQLLPANPFRWGLLMSVTGGVGATVWLGGLAVAPPSSFQVFNSQLATWLSYRDLGAAICQQVGAIGLAVGVAINWQEFLSPTPLG